jgi:hypothetical protein
MSLNGAGIGGGLTGEDVHRILKIFRCQMGRRLGQGGEFLGDQIPSGGIPPPKCDLGVTAVSITTAYEDHTIRGGYRSTIGQRPGKLYKTLPPISSGFKHVYVCIPGFVA